MFVKNVKKRENQEKSLQKWDFADFFSKFIRKSLLRLAFDEIRHAFGACRCKIFKKFAFLSAAISQAIFTKKYIICNCAYILQTINVERTALL